MNSDSRKKNKHKMTNRSKNSENNGSIKARWVYRVFLLAFVLSVFFSFISETLMDRFNIFISIFVLLVIIAIGIIFDIIGIAVTSASETPFHAMAADKVPGGKEAVKLIRNADIVSNFCNDVVGDICGILSGAAGAAIVLKALALAKHINETALSILMAGIISTLTIGGKAIGKGIAINNSKKVVHNVALVIFTIKQRLGIDILASISGKRDTSKR